MNTALSLWQTVCLSGVVLAALFVPFLFKKAEEELEIFLFVCGIAAVSVSGLWSGHLLLEAVKEPVLISAAVLVLGFLFKRFGGGLNAFVHRAEKSVGPRWFLFFFVLALGLCSSLITAIIAISFATLGFAWPQLFRRIFPICMIALGIMIIIELVMMFLGIPSGWNDWVVIVIFCGLIGYDFYQAATDEPTVDNAIWYACEIYLDLINIFLRVLNITGRSRD